MNVEFFLRSHPLFGALPASLVAELAARARTRAVAAGEILCREGDAAESVYVLLSGRIEVERDGKGAVASLGRRGELMGEMSILTGNPRSATLRAELPSELLEIPASAFQQALDRSPDLGLRLAQVLSLRLSGAASPPSSTRRPCYAGFLMAGPQRVPAARALAAQMVGVLGRPVLVYDLGATQNAPGLLQTLSNVPVEGQEQFVRTLAQQNPTGVTELTGTIREDHWSYFLSILRETYDRVVFGIPIPFFQPIHKTVCEACDVLVPVCGREIPADSAVEKLRALGKPMVVARTQGRARAPWVGFAGVSDLAIPASEEDVADPKALAPIARKLLGRSIGVALGSGAARGYAHIGVLEELEREKLPIDYVAGTSMGSVLGGLYAAGRSPAEMAEFSRDASRLRAIFSLLDLAIPTSGLLRGRRVEKHFRKLMGDVEIERLPRPFRTVATDVLTGEEVVLDRGPLWKAIRASISLPCLFEPARHGSRYLVDGGVTNPIPVNHLLDLGADRTIAVNVTAGPPQGARAPGILTVMMNSIYTLQTLVSDARSSLADVTIVPEFGGLSWTDFAKAPEMIEAGRAAVRRALPEIRRLVT
ncbi:MAG: patatin-like phospholipase family protein [Planctomycetes bacterium]|nr:patatin-like phospholipase family protein [Planctomycetota bacterium]